MEVQLAIIVGIEGLAVVGRRSPLDVTVETLSELADVLGGNIVGGGLVVVSDYARLGHDRVDFVLGDTADREGEFLGVGIEVAVSGAGVGGYVAVHLVVLPGGLVRHGSSDGGELPPEPVVLQMDLFGVVGHVIRIAVSGHVFLNLYASYKKSQKKKDGDNQNNIRHSILVLQFILYQYKFNKIVFS